MEVKTWTLLLMILVMLPMRADVVADPFSPAHLTSLYIERDDAGTTTLIRLEGEAVIYRQTTGGKVVENLTVHPSMDDWFHFIQGLNAAKVYKWQPRYEYPGQGGAWVIDFATDDRKFSSQGTNDYPKNGAETEPADPQAGPSIPFLLFWQAALGLVGKASAPAPAK